jgi:hypothetical protein
MLAVSRLVRCRRSYTLSTCHRQTVVEAGRDPQSLPVTMGGAPEDLARLERFRDLGAVRVNVSLPAESADKILPVLDRWAKLERQLAS